MGGKLKQPVFLVRCDVVFQSRDTVPLQLLFIAGDYEGLKPRLPQLPTRPVGDRQ